VVPDTPNSCSSREAGQKSVRLVWKFPHGFTVNHSIMVQNSGVAMLRRSALKHGDSQGFSRHMHSWDFSTRSRSNAGRGCVHGYRCHLGNKRFERAETSAARAFSRIQGVPTDVRRQADVDVSFPSAVSIQQRNNIPGYKHSGFDGDARSQRSGLQCYRPENWDGSRSQRARVESGQSTNRQAGNLSLS